MTNGYQYSIRLIKKKIYFNNLYSIYLNKKNILWFGWEQPPYPISENYGEESHRIYQKDK